MKAYQKLIQDAFSALVCGDAAERDRCLTAALNVLNAEERVGWGHPVMLGDPIILPDRSISKTPADGAALLSTRRRVLDVACVLPALQRELVRQK